MLPVATNREVYRLLRDGITVELRHADGSLKPERVRLVGWIDPASNDFSWHPSLGLEASCIHAGRMPSGLSMASRYSCASGGRPSSPCRKPTTATSVTRDTIPRLFDANNFTLSNGLKTLMGDGHAPFETFAAWKRLEEDGPESTSLETLLRATCEPARFLDLIENFILFEDARGGLRKVLAKYHQALGVKRAIEVALREAAVQATLLG